MGVILYLCIMGEAVKIIILGTEGEKVITLPEGTDCSVIIDFLNTL